MIEPGRHLPQPLACQYDLPPPRLNRFFRQRWIFFHGVNTGYRVIVFSCEFLTTPQGEASSFV